MMRRRERRACVLPKGPLHVCNCCTQCLKHGNHRRFHRRRFDVESGGELSQKLDARRIRKLTHAQSFMIRRQYGNTDVSRDVIARLLAIVGLWDT